MIFRPEFIPEFIFYDKRIFYLLGNVDILFIYKISYIVYKISNIYQIFYKVYTFGIKYNI